MLEEELWGRCCVRAGILSPFRQGSRANFNGITRESIKDKVFVCLSLPPRDTAACRCRCGRFISPKSFHFPASLEGVRRT